MISEYKLPPTLDALVNPNFQTELWASVYRPAVLEASGFEFAHPDPESILRWALAN